MYLCLISTHKLLLSAAIIFGDFFVICMREGFLTFYGISRWILLLGSRVEINNKDYAWYIWNVIWEVPMKKVIISSHNMFLTWITITAEISRNVTSVSLIWPKAAILVAILMVILILWYHIDSSLSLVYII